MLEKCEADIARFTAEINAIRNYDETIRKRKSRIKQSIDLIDDIIREGAISDEHLRMLVDVILISEVNNEQSIEIVMKANFQNCLNMYDENGELTDGVFLPEDFL